MAQLHEGPFGDAHVRIAAETLQRAGVGVADGFGPGGSEPVRLTRWQVRNLAAEAYARGGQTGAEIDTMVPPAPGMPPLGFLLNAWMLDYGSDASRFARALVGEHDWKHPEAVVYPRLVVTLFFADAAAAKNAPPASVAPPTAGTRPPSTTRTARPTDAGSPGTRTAGPSKSPTATVETTADAPPEDAAAADPDAAPSRTSAVASPLAYVQKAPGCGAVVDFVESNLKSLANFYKVDASGSGPFVRFLAAIWNTVVDLAVTVVKALFTVLAAPVVEAVGGVLTAVGAAYQISTLLKQWTVKMEPTPVKNAFGIGKPNPGRFKVTVTDDRFELPAELESCSRAAGLDLAKAGAPGSKVTWTSVPGGRKDLAVQTGADAVITENRTASFSYDTGTETADQAKGTEVSGLYEVRASIRREKIEQLRTFIADTLLAPLNALPLPEPVRAFIRGITADAIGAATDKVAQFTDVKAYNLVPISYHDPAQNPKPAPPPVDSDTPPKPPAGDLCHLITPGSYKGTLAYSTNVGSSNGGLWQKGTGPITFTVAADGTVTGAWTQDVTLNSVDHTTTHRAKVVDGKVTGRGCRPVLSGGALIYFDKQGQQLDAIPFDYFGDTLPQPDNFALNGRTITSHTTATQTLANFNRTVTLTATR